MTLWQAIKNSRKAIVAGAAAALAFIAATLQDHPGQDLTMRQWLDAAVIYAAAHATIWLVGNEKPPPPVPPAAVAVSPIAHTVVSLPGGPPPTPQKPAERPFPAPLPNPADMHGLT